MKDDVLKLENQLCFPLYACSRAIIKAYNPFLRRLDLTYTQYLVMLVLWTEKRINVKKLGEYLHLDSGTLTPLLKKMEAKNLLRRERSVEDERILLVSITEAGAALREKARAIPAEMGRCLGIAPTEIKVLYDLLYKVLENLKK